MLALQGLVQQLQLAPDVTAGTAADCNPAVMGAIGRGISLVRCPSADGYPDAMRITRVSGYCG